MIAHILIATSLGCRHVKVNDLSIDVPAVLESRNEWPNVLESGTANKLRGGILQESVVDLGQLLGLVLDPRNFCDLCHLVSTRFSHLLFAVLGQLVIQWENLVLEEFE